MVNEKKEPLNILKLVSLLLALLLWVNLSGRVDKASQIDARIFPSTDVVFVNKPQNMELKADNYLAQVTVQGPDNVLRDITAADLQIQIDLKDYRPGRYNLPLTNDVVKLNAPVDQSVEVTQIIPNAVSFELEHWTEKKLTLHLKIDGEPAENFEIVDTSIVPRTVTVRGPTDQVKDLLVVISDPVDVTGQDSDMAGSFTFDFNRQIPSNVVINENLKDFRYIIQIDERQITRPISGEIDIEKIPPDPEVANGLDWTNFKVKTLKTELTISGPISVVNWVDPRWVKPRISIPLPEEELQPEATEGAPLEPARTVAIRNFWELPQEVIDAYPDWYARINKLALTWTPSQVEVEKL